MSREKERLYSKNSLQKENIRSLGDLVQRSEDDMLQIENFGKKSLKEISDFPGVSGDITYAGTNGIPPKAVPIVIVEGGANVLLDTIG